MIKYLKSTNLSSYLILLGLFVIIKLPVWLNGINQPIEINEFAHTHLFIFVENYNLSFGLAQLVIFIQAIIINYLFTNSHFIRQKTIVPAYIFIVLSSVVNSYNFINIYHIILSIFIGLYYLFLKINFQEQVKSDIFNVGCLFGVAIVLFPNLIFFTPFLLIIVYVVKPLRIKEILLAVIGILCVLFFYFSFVYLLDIKIAVPFDFYFYPSNITNLEVSSQIKIFVLAICSIISLFGMIGIKQSTENRVKRNVDMIFLLAVSLFLIIVFNTYFFPNNIVFIFLPSTVFISIFLHRNKKQKVIEIFNFFLLFSIIIANFYQS